MGHPFSDFLSTLLPVRHLKFNGNIHEEVLNEDATWIGGFAQPFINKPIPKVGFWPTTYPDCTVDISAPASVARGSQLATSWNPNGVVNRTVVCTCIMRSTTGLFTIVGSNYNTNTTDNLFNIWTASLQCGRGFLKSMVVDTPYFLLLEDTPTSSKLYVDGVLGIEIISAQTSFVAQYYCGVAYGEKDMDVGDIAILERVLTDVEKVGLLDAYNNDSVPFGGLEFLGSAPATPDTATTTFVETPSGGIEFLGEAESIFVHPGFYVPSGGISFGGSVTPTFAGTLRAVDSLSVDANPLNTLALSSYDKFTMDDLSSKNLTVIKTLYETINVIDKDIPYPLRLIAQDSASVLSLTIPRVHLDLVAISAISIVSTLVSQYTLTQKAITAIDLTEMSKLAMHMTGLSNFSCNDVIELTVSKILTALSQMLVEAECNKGIFIHCIAQDSLDLNAVNITQSELRMIAQDSLLFVGMLEGDVNYLGYVLNTLTGGISTYEDYNFNSFSEGLACGKDGIYKLTPNLPVSWQLKTGLSNLGSENQKQIPYMYLGITSTGKVVLKTITDLHGVKREVWYEKTISNASLDTTRIQLGKGVKSVYWQFKLSGDDVAELSSIELIPLELTRRI